MSVSFLYIRQGTTTGDVQRYVVGMTWRAISPFSFGEVECELEVALLLAERFMREHRLTLDNDPAERRGD